MRRGAGIAGNPVLIGAATVLVVLVAVFLAYNANKGLPFVPTYELKAEVPSAANLVKGNDVRIGGSRVGFVSAIEPQTNDDGVTVAVLTLKLEKSVAPLPRDSTLIVRPRSALGLKYVEITPRHRRARLRRRRDDPDRRRHARGRSSWTRSSACSTTRRAKASRMNTTGFGDAFAGRGESHQHGDRRRSSRCCATSCRSRRTCRSPDTDLRGFFRALGRHGRDRRARRRGPGRAVRQPRHHVPRPARGRAAVIQESIIEGVPGARRRHPRLPDPAPVPAQQRAAVPRAAPGRRARCARTRRRSPTRSRSGAEGPAAHAAAQPPPGASLLESSCSASPRTRWSRAACRRPPRRCTR